MQPKCVEKARTRSLVSSLLALVVFSVLLGTRVFAQNGSGIISGHVVDASGAVLQGARVELPVAALSAVSDGQGDFRFTGMTPGSYNLTVSYVGFSAFVTDVTVNAGQVARVSAVLKVASKNEEIVVTGDRPHGEAEAINRERTSDNILNVLPSDVIRSLPNANIADAVGRMPSVTLERDEGEGKYVQIRGTEPRLNNLTIDGVNVPSPEATVRQVKLDTIPADIVESVEINKTLSANQDGDAIGGSVNLVTKTAGELPTLTLEGIGGFTPILDTRYVGQIDGTVGQRFGANKRWGLLIGGSFDYNGRGIDDIEPAPTVTSLTPAYDSIDIREYRYHRKRDGFGGSLDYKLGEGSGLYARFLYSDFKDFGDKWVYTLQNNDVPKFSTSNRVPDFLVSSLSIGGKHVFAKSWLSWELSAARSRQLNAAGDPGIDFQYNGPTTDSSGNPICFYDAAATKTPYRPQFNPGCTAPGSPVYNPSQYSLLDINTTSGLTSQVNLQGSVSMAKNYQWGSHSGTFEFGLKERNGHKGQDAYSPTYDQNNLSNPPATPLMTQFLGPFANSNYYDGSYRLGPVTQFNKIIGDLNSLVSQNILPLDEGATRLASDSNNYDLTERVSAAYAMNTLRFGHFHLQTGFRLEATQLNILGYHVTNDANGNYISTTQVPSSAYYISPLPTVQLRYALTDNADIRASYGRGISRPDPFDLVPYVTEDRSTNPTTFSLGNPNLKPEHANSYDLLYQQYLKPFGEIQAGFFYKDLSDPIYFVNARTVNSGPYTGFQLAQIINGSSASLWGFEAAYIQHLGFLPGLLSGLGISANYSWTTSQANNLPGRSDTPALQRQAPNTWNISPTYDRGRLSVRMGLSYNGASIFQYQYQTQPAGTPDYGAKGPNGDQYLYAHLQVDAQGSFRVRKDLSVLVQGLNLTNEVFGFYNGSPLYVDQREYYKPTYSFGLRWQPRRED
jgi:TonB-dependent receptor